MIDLDRMDIVDRIDDLFVQGLVWRPDANDLAIYCSDRLVLLRALGGRESLTWPQQRMSFGRATLWTSPWAPFCIWTPSGRSLAVLDRVNGESLLAIHDAETLRPLGATIVDPATLLPYDGPGLREQSRGRGVVHRLGEDESWYGGEYASDDLLPNWLNAVYDQRTSNLSLGTYRPLGLAGPSPDQAGKNLVPDLLRSSETFLSSRIGRQLTSASTLQVYKAWVRIAVVD